MERGKRLIKNGFADCAAAVFISQEGLCVCVRVCVMSGQVFWGIFIFAGAVRGKQWGDSACGTREVVISNILLQGFCTGALSHINPTLYFMKGEQALEQQVQAGILGLNSTKTKISAPARGGEVFFNEEQPVQRELGC